MLNTKKLLTAALAGIVVSASSFVLAASLARGDTRTHTVTRELPWDGSESLYVDVPANVHYVQTAGEGKVIVTGAARSVSSLRAEGGELRDERWHTGDALDITLYAPKVSRFSIKGKDTLVIENYDQPELHIETSGRADVRASGRAGVVTLALEGAGWVDLSQLVSAGAEVSLTGSRHALLAPTEWAKVSGGGSVVFVTRPAKVETNLGESGKVLYAAAPGTQH